LACQLHSNQIIIFPVSGGKKHRHQGKSHKGKGGRRSEETEYEILPRIKAVAALKRLAFGHNPKTIHLLGSIFFNTNEDPEVILFSFFFGSFYKQHFLTARDYFSEFILLYLFASQICLGQDGLNFFLPHHTCLVKIIIISIS